MVAVLNDTSSWIRPLVGSTEWITSRKNTQSITEVYEQVGKTRDAAYYEGKLKELKLKDAVKAAQDELRKLRGKKK